MTKERGVELLDSLLKTMKSYKDGYGNYNMILMASDETVEAMKMALDSLRVKPSFEEITTPATTIHGKVSVPIEFCFNEDANEVAEHVAHEVSAELSKQLIPYIDFSIAHPEPGDPIFPVKHVFEGSVEVAVKPIRGLDYIARYLKFFQL